MGKMKIVLAFSGGLDTSFCVVYLREEHNADVVTVTVNTGGFTPRQVKEIENRARQLKVARHYTIDGRKDVYDRFLTNIIRGNILRGGVYPLCVGAERIVQAEKTAEIALKLKAEAVAHGSTGAGNDQVRFDVAFAVRAPRLKVLTPIRTLGYSRAQEAEYLRNRGVDVAANVRLYSYNDGLVGTTIGGGATHDPWQEIPEEVFRKTVSADRAPAKPRYLTIGFNNGLPVALDGRKMAGVALVEALNEVAGRHGVGRGIHIGDTILGIKGRIAFEAPAPIVLIAAHRELEKLVLTKWESFWKNHLADFYGSFLHEGQYDDPVMRDIEAFLRKSQEHVRGDVRVRLHKSRADVVGVRSPFSMMKKDVATYGESAHLWSWGEAAGFCRIAGVHSMLARAARAGGRRK